ncbi:ATP-dependent nuclease [Pedobacter miscanthi]|uniref:ATP-dependent nuclease n=1 Tax=Pedobacter miscanthi TaxID=2259170 RepID=UPI002931498B|nr:AAA family ATPase [Pedobacter miscanthi]
MIDGRPVHPVNLIGLFLKKLETQDRLNLVNPSPNISFGQRATTPIQRLKQNTDIELNFSRLFRKAFKHDLIVNHDGGQVIPLHVGDRPESTKDNDRVSKEYSEKIYKMGQLQTQGDGMKSFAGVFLSLFADNYSINIIDEPEAFLHPPQAMLLGEMLAKNLNQDKQLFISTHSEHFLKGMLAYGGKRLIVVRLLREGNDTKTTLLDNKALQKIWKEPILKHSNILDGLFHAKVVLCESEGDSRFFSAISSALIDDANISSPDIHYVQCGGKHQFPTAINALKKLNVPLIVIGDFDLLNNQKPLEDVFVGLGGVWDDIKDDWKIVKSDIDTQRPELSSDDMKKNIIEILDKITNTVVTDDNIKELESTIKKASAWGVAKRLGKKCIRAGNATQSYNRINEAFKNLGLIILEVGEIECFDLTVGNHGPKWVNKVLEKDLLESDDLKEAREFVKKYILEV